MNDLEILKERLNNTIERLNKTEKVIDDDIRNLTDRINKLEDKLEDGNDDIKDLNEKVGTMYNVISYLKGSFKTVFVVCSIAVFAFEVLKYLGINLSFM